MFQKVYISSKPKICFNHYGDGELIIFLHGIGGNKDNWNSNICELGKYFHCVAWDTRGYGESDDYEGSFDFDEVIEDIIYIFKHFNKNKAHIVGLSMGGQIACLFYEKYPHFVSSLILCDTHFGLANLDKIEKDNFINIRKKPLLSGLKPEDIALPVAKTLIGNLRNKKALDELIDSLKKLHKNSYLKTIDASFRRSHDQIFKTIKVPTLVLVGRDDKLTPPEMAIKIHKLIKNSEFKIINNAGHLSNIENPKEFNLAIIDFISKV